MINKNIKSTKIIYATALRELCIKQDWYTNGTNDEYDSLFHMASAFNINDNTLYLLAMDIKQHSDTDRDIPDIMYELNEISHTTYEIIK